MAVRLGEFVFLGHPRSASNAISAAMLAAGGQRLAPNHNVVLGGNHHYFCVIRNPIDVLEAWFTVSQEPCELAFARGYTHSFFAPGGRLYYLAQHCRTLLCYDRLDAGLHALCGLTLTRVNTLGAHKILSAEARALAEARFPLDFQLWEEMKNDYPS